MEMSEGKISEATLRRMAKLSREYDDLYIKTGFIGVGDKYIQLQEEHFIATFPDYETSKRDFHTYHEELSAEFNGVKFIAIR